MRGKVKRSALDILCEIVLLLSKESLRKTKIQLKANVEPKKIDPFLEFLQEKKLIECLKVTKKYKPQDFKPYVNLHLWHSERYVYRATERGLKVAQAWQIIKNLLNIKW